MTARARSPTRWRPPGCSTRRWTPGGSWAGASPGPGKWVTIYTNPGHVYMVVAGVRFDTSGTRVTGSRWQASMRPGGGFVARHPEGL